MIGPLALPLIFLFPNLHGENGDHAYGTRQDQIKSEPAGDRNRPTVLSEKKPSTEAGLAAHALCGRTFDALRWTRWNNNGKHRLSGDAAASRLPLAVPRRKKPEENAHGRSRRRARGFRNQDAAQGHLVWLALPPHCYLDRVNVGFGGATMRTDLDLSATAFGGAAGIFFVAYFFFEVPSNLALNAFGARRWIARIMFTWGIISGLQAFITGEWSFYGIRLLLGVAEAGFFPGIIFYLTLWFPTAYRARIVGWFMFAIPISTVIGAPISGLMLGLEGVGGLHGWQWMFILEAIPALVMTFFVLYYLTDRPMEAGWLAPQEREWLQGRLDRERTERERILELSWFRSMLDWRVFALGLVYMGCNIPQYGLSFFLPQIVKAFGVSNLTAGFITAVPYLVGAVGMIVWGTHSDRTGERKWHAVIAFLFIIVGLGLASVVNDPTLKMLLSVHRRF